jgi:hypothetical protein
MVGRPAHVAKAPPFYPKGVVIELKREIVEGRGGRRWPVGHQSLADRPCLASTQSLLSSSTHLAPIMLTPLTKSIKSKANSFHPFPKLFLFIFLKFLGFILHNDEINMLWKRKNKNGE